MNALLRGGALRAVLALPPALAALYVAGTQIPGSTLLPWQPNMLDLAVYQRVGGLVLAGGDIFDPQGQLPWIYPGFAALLTVPFAALTFTVAALAWLLLCAAALAAVLHGRTRRLAVEPGYHGGDPARAAGAGHPGLRPARDPAGCGGRARLDARAAAAAPPVASRGLAGRGGHRGQAHPRRGRRVQLLRRSPPGRPGRVLLLPGRHGDRVPGAAAGRLAGVLGAAGFGGFGAQLGDRVRVQPVGAGRVEPAHRRPRPGWVGAECRRGPARGGGRRCCCTVAGRWRWPCAWRD